MLDCEQSIRRLILVISAKYRHTHAEMGSNEVKRLLAEPNFACARVFCQNHQNQRLLTVYFDRNRCNKSEAIFQQVQVKKRKWSWIRHTLRKDANNITHQAVRWNPQGKPKRRRPRKTLLTVRSVAGELDSIGNN